MTKGGLKHATKYDIIWEQFLIPLESTKQQNYLSNQSIKEIGRRTNFKKKKREEILAI